MTTQESPEEHIANAMQLVLSLSVDSSTAAHEATVLAIDERLQRALDGMRARESAPAPAPVSSATDGPVAERLAQLRALADASPPVYHRPHRHERRPLRFRGWWLGQATRRELDNRGYAVGEVVYSLYITEAGALILTAEAYQPKGGGTRDAAVVPGLDALYDQCGWQTASELCHCAGIDPAREVP